MKVEIYTHTTVFDKLIWCIVGPKSFLFGTAQYSHWASGAVNCDYIASKHMTYNVNLFQK